MSRNLKSNKSKLKKKQSIKKLIKLSNKKYSNKLKKSNNINFNKYKIHKGGVNVYDLMTLPDEKYQEYISNFLDINLQVNSTLTNNAVNVHNINLSGNTIDLHFSGNCVNLQSEKDKLYCDLLFINIYTHLKNKHTSESTANNRFITFDENNNIIKLTIDDHINNRINAYATKLKNVFNNINNAQSKVNKAQSVKDLITKFNNGIIPIKNNKMKNNKNYMSTLIEKFIYNLIIIIKNNNSTSSEQSQVQNGGFVLAIVIPLIILCLFLYLSEKVFKKQEW